MSRQTVEKGWGREIIFASNELYCGKILQFDKAGAKGSMHYHMKKDETFMVVTGSFNLRTIDQATAQIKEETIVMGHVVRVMQASFISSRLSRTTPPYSRCRVRTTQLTTTA